MGKKLLPFILLFLFALPIVYKLLQFEMYGTVDGWAHLFQQVLFNQAISDGQIPPGWAGGVDYGFGTPLFLFYWSFPFYCIYLIMALGVPLIPASHIFTALCAIGSGFSMYYFLRQYFDKFSSLIGSILFIYSPYRLAMTFVYDAWGEVSALFFGPLFLGLISSLHEKPTRLRKFLLFLTSICLILSHNGLAVMFFAMGGTLFLAFRPRIKYFLSVSIPVGMALISTCYFWVVSITENTGFYLINEQTKSIARSTTYRDITSMIMVDLNSLMLKPAWFTSFSPGIIIVILGGLGVLGFLWSLKKKKRQVFLFLWAALWFIVPFFLLSYKSDFIWDKVFLLKMLLYAYRMIVFITIGGIFLGTYFISILGKNRYFFSFVIIPALIIGYAFIEPNIHHGKFDSSYFYQDQPPYYAPETSLSMGGEDFLPMKVPREYLLGLQKNGKPKEFLDGEGVKMVEKVWRNSYKATFDLEAVKDSRVSVNLFYFPGWRVKLNGKEAAVFDDDKGRVAFDIKEGKSHVEAEFGDTPKRAFLKLISLSGTVLFLVVLVLIF